MRVASLVPSWTETLLAAGADVVARTRFCIHPPSPHIPAVGGTKEVDWAKLVATGAELVILDREENPLAMASASPLPFWDSHITSVQDMPASLRSLASVFQQAGDESVALTLEGFAVRWESVLSSPVPAVSLDQLPGVLEWLRPASSACAKTLYLIWKNPYMVAGRNTFIGSMLSLFGVELEIYPTKYPEVELSLYDPTTTLLLFSSEPFPFAKSKFEIARLPFASALVDGESFSWFGLRSLQFLESYK